MFKTREIAGWLLVLFGLYLLRMGLDFVGDRKVVEASVVVFAHEQADVVRRSNIWRGAG